MSLKWDHLTEYTPTAITLAQWHLLWLQLANNCTHMIFKMTVDTGVIKMMQHVCALLQNRNSSIDGFVDSPSRFDGTRWFGGLMLRVSSFVVFLSLLALSGLVVVLLSLKVLNGFFRTPRLTSRYL